MKWIEISVECDGEAAEAVCELFNRFNQGTDASGSQGGAVVEISGFANRAPDGGPPGEQDQPVITVRTYLPADKSADTRRKKIEQGLWHLSLLYPIPEPAIRELAEEDWATAWRVHYKPQRVGQRLLIVPAWQVDEALAQAEGNAGELLLPVIVEPGMAFGTGLHPSTRLCMAALERHMQPGDSLLDVGCGSGILSITGARLGAGSILATDIDPIAVAATLENSQLNGLQGRIQARQGSLPDPAERPEGWRIIVVNILADVIVQLLARGLDRLLATDGRLVLSGIIDEAAPDVLAALKQRGLEVIERTDEGDWVGLVAAFASPRSWEIAG